MGIDTGRSRGKQSTSVAVWAVTGVVCLGTVLGVWLMRPEGQPSNVFGAGGAIALLLASLIALVAASVSRGASTGFRRVVGVVTLVLALCAEILALAYFGAGRGSADTAFGLILSVGAVAMIAAVIGVLRGRPA